MGYCISVCNEKGGVGKTVTVCNLAALMAQDGKRVLVVDMDAQGNCTYTLTGARVTDNTFGGTARRHLNLRQYCGLQKTGTPCRAASLRCCYSFYYIICFACVNGYFDEYHAGISSLLFTFFLCRFPFPSFFTSSRHSRSPIIPRSI